MKTERELYVLELGGFGVIDAVFNDIDECIEFSCFSYCGLTKDDITFGYRIWLASKNRESSKLVPCNPTEEMWGGTARQLVKYMQMKDRYCPASLKKHFDRFIGEIPDWLNEEVQDWTSEHAFATADLGVFIYKAMYHEFKN